VLPSQNTVKKMVVRTTKMVDIPF